MNIINNIGKLRQNLIDNGHHMTVFLFSFKGIEYDVIFENNENYKNRRNKFASVLLTFIDIKNPARQYSVEANQIRMFVNVKKFREFFGIEYSSNLGDVISQFYDRFVSFVPEKEPNLNSRQDKLIDKQLASKGAHNPDAIYCYDARRLGFRDGNQLHRSIFISNLTERKKPDLYKYFKNETTVTFYYSPNSGDELSDIDIIEKFRKRETKK